VYACLSACTAQDDPDVTSRKRVDTVHAIGDADGDVDDKQSDARDDDDDDDETRAMASWREARVFVSSTFVDMQGEVCELCAIT
jgi:hypothetical protein